MKHPPPALRLLALAIAATVSAHAAVPTINCTVDSFYLGSGVTFSPTVADADKDMDYTTFEVSVLGTPGWTTLSPDVNVPNVGFPAQQTGVVVPKSWTPSLPGQWTVRITVHSLNGSSTASFVFDVLAGTRTISPVTIASGAAQIFSFSGEIATTNTSPDSVVVQSGGALILWSGGRIKLEPGFHAQAGTNPASLFWAAIDHNMNGYSDIEELQQNFVPGVPDAWLADQALMDSGINLGQPISTWAYTAAQLQAAYQGGYKSTDIVNAAKTTTYPLVLATPSGQYYGVQTSTWAITSL